MAQDQYNAPFYDQHGNLRWPAEVPEWAGGQEGAEDFFNVLRAAWVQSDDSHKRLLVAENGGPDEWQALLHDEDFMVRAAVAMSGDAACHKALAGDSSPFVREYVARYGGREVLETIADTEQEREVILQLARRRMPSVLHRLVEQNWERPEILSDIMPYAGNSDRDRLLTHSDPSVRLRVGEFGTRKQISAVLADKDIPDIRKIMVEWRLQDLEEIAAALVPDRVREHVQHQDLSR